MSQNAASEPALRSINPEELLGREPVQLHTEQARSRIAGRVVMVTGAAGSIGAELCRQLLGCDPALLVCLDHAETPLFLLQQALQDVPGHTAFCLADITHESRMRAVMKRYGVQAIFHAAACKHVPLMEANPEEAVRHNVFGLETVLKVAEQSGCEDFLFLSSDKAVHPAGVMGCTKRIGELMIADCRASAMRCLSVRFGNVLSSQGSVVPLFQEQMRRHREITVTHAEMTRYFMTIPEAVSLVLQGFAIGERGDVLVLDMGEPVRITEMAKSLIALAGFSPDEVRIVYTGLRPGEKLQERLFYDFEQRVATSVEKISRAEGEAGSVVEASLQALKAACEAADEAKIRAQLKALVPQYQWEQGGGVSAGEKQ